MRPAAAQESLLSNSYQQHIESSASSTEYTHKPTSETAGPTKQRARQWQTLWSWNFEALSWFGSLCSFIAIIAVLRVFEGKPLPELWFGISPNAIIGILATLTELLLYVPVRAGLGQAKWLQALEKRPMDDFRLMDDASRGPMGSILLLTHRRGGVSASLGALVSILALGIAAFTQQALRYQTVFLPSDDAYMPIADALNGTGWAQLADDTNLYGIDPQMQSAPYAGLFSPPNTTFTATAHCGTGNCTWEPYETLGVCNTCVDLTSRLERIKATAVLTLDDMVRQKMSKLYYTTNHYALPNGFTLMGKQTGDLYEPRAAHSNGLLNLTTTLGSPEGGTSAYDRVNKSSWDSIVFANNGSRLFSVFGIGPSNGSFIEQPDSNFTAPPTTPKEDEEDANDNVANPGTVWAPPVAFECLLQYCVRTMRAATVNGSIHEIEVSRWTNQTQHYYNDTEYFTDIVLQPPGSSKTFRVNGYAGGVLSDWLSTYLQGHVTGWRSDEALSRDLLGYDSPMQDIIVPSSLFVQPLYKAMNESTSGFPDLMENLANALSLGMRRLPYQPAAIRGKAFTPTTRAVITWPWLVLPAVSILGSLAFLVAVMLETRRRDMVPWTNNVLAYFFHGLERPIANEVLLSQHEMERKAKRVMVEFRQDIDREQLVVVKV